MDHMKPTTNNIVQKQGNGNERVLCITRKTCERVNHTPTNNTNEFPNQSINRYGKRRVLFFFPSLPLFLHEMYLYGLNFRQPLEDLYHMFKVVVFGEHIGGKALAILCAHLSSVQKKQGRRVRISLLYIRCIGRGGKREGQGQVYIYIYIHVL